MQPNCPLPRVSIIVIALNEEGTVGECISSLLGQDYPNFSITFIDGGSSDRTWEIVSSTADRRRLSMQADNEGTPASARNKGIESSDSDIVAFVDGDCSMERDWLTKAVRRLTNGDVYLGGVGGPNIQKYDSDHQQSLAISLTQSTLLGSGGSAEVRVFREDRFVKSLSFRNAIFWSRVFRQAGLFDESLFYCEDSELCQRVRSAGYKLLYSNEIGTHHSVKYDSVATLCRKMYNYGCGRGKAIRKYKNLFTWFSAATILYALTFLTLTSIGFILSLDTFRLIGLALALSYLAAILASSLLIVAKTGGIVMLGRIYASYLAIHVPYTAGLFIGILSPGRVRDSQRAAASR